MQVIFLPSGSGPSRNFRVRVRLVALAAGGAVLSAVLAGTWLGYSLGAANPGEPVSAPGPIAMERASSGPRLPQAETSSGETVPAAVPRPGAGTRGPRTFEAAYAKVDPHSRIVPYHLVDHGRIHGLTGDGAERIAALRRSLEEQRRMLREARRRLGDQLDSLGQRLGRIQASVTRLDALGQRLTDMAGLDRGEFSFDSVPGIGGPERSGPWEQIQQPEFAESLHMIEIELAEKEKELSILEALLTDRELHEKQYPQGWPTAEGGWMSSGYGYRTDPFTGRRAFHEGVDIAARSGSKIRAMAAGVVSFAGRKSGYGLVVEINHGNGFQTRYAHARKILASVGDRVEKGDTVGLVGSTGRSTGSHVHVEVLQNGKSINPHEHLRNAG